MFGGNDSETAALAEFIGSLKQRDPAAFDNLIASGLFGEQMGMANQDWTQGGALMGTPSPEGMRVGGTYVASSPLEHLATAMARSRGAGQQADARRRQQEFMASLNRGKGDLLSEMARQRQAQQMPQDPNAAAPWIPPKPPQFY
jgi:hypothetical protein